MYWLFGDIKNIQGKFADFTHKHSTDFEDSGFVNFEKKQYSYGPNLQYDINFSKLVNFTDYEFYLDNDGNVAAYCEYLLSYKNKFSNLIMLTFGTGVGGGIISEGKLLRGQGSAGELGHMLTSNNRDVLCGCRKKGCYEASVAASVWTQRCSQLSLENKTSELAKRFEIGRAHV